MNHPPPAEGLAAPLQQSQQSEPPDARGHLYVREVIAKQVGWMSVSGGCDITPHFQLTAAGKERVPVRGWRWKLFTEVL